MTFKCSVPGCRSNYKDNLKFSVFSFPRNETLHQMWIKAIPNENFKTYKHSRVCELHFEPDQIIREASAFDPRTGRTLTAPLTVPRLRKGAVPSLFLPSSGPVGRTGLYQYKLANRKRKPEQKVKAQKGETKATDGSELAKLLQTLPDAESQPVSEPSIAIKQEVVESVNEPPSLVIKNILCAEDLASSSNSSFSFSNLPPDLGSSHPVTNPDSTNVDESQETNILNRLQRKRKINSVVPDADGSTSKATRAKLHRRTKTSSPSMRNRSHPTAGTSKKSTGCSISSTKNAEDGTREKLQSSLNDFGNIPSLGSRSGGEKHRDLFDVFADFIAQKLREMNWDKCASSLRNILDIVFKAGQEQRDSDEDSDISSPDSSSTSSSHEE
ncbi:THAP domain-containing protein 2 [Argiope bruennichi]|uniref:THAP domain-containing protein 2 n=1 Tax=Argiope bruennichi TaxID=94029 RepID=A0A8T0ENI8_ARGBR|nr:THAP domain-containing protein 2 [Argiope bruennichi]